VVQNEKNRCENMVICVKILLRDIRTLFREVCGERGVQFCHAYKRGKTGSDLSTSLFNIFFNYTVECIEIEWLKVTAMRGLNIFINIISEIVDIERASCPGCRSIKYFYK
jgi:hypothetical protein